MLNNRYHKRFSDLTHLNDKGLDEIRFDLRKQGFENCSYSEQDYILKELINYRLDPAPEAKQIVISRNPVGELLLIVLVNGWVKIKSSLDITSLEFIDNLELKEVTCILATETQGRVTVTERVRKYPYRYNKIFQYAWDRVLRFRALAQAIRMITPLGSIVDEWEALDICYDKHKADMPEPQALPIDTIIESIGRDADWEQRLNFALSEGMFVISEADLAIIKQRLGSPH